MITRPFFLLSFGHGGRGCACQMVYLLSSEEDPGKVRWAFISHHSGLKTLIVDPDSPSEFWESLQKLSTDAPVFVVTNVLDELGC